MNERTKTVLGPFRDVPFGEIVRQACEAQGLTQRELAERLGVTSPRIVEIFASRSITEQSFDRCVAALGLALEVRLVAR